MKNALVKRKWLVRFRDAKKMKQREVAIECSKLYNVHISRSTYANYERGEKNPSPERAQAIGAVLGFPWTFFYTLECSDKDQ